MIRVEGKVVLRPADMKNEKTGEIEVGSGENILFRSKVPPFEIAEIEGWIKRKR